jgi:beta-glucosidase
MDYNLRDGRTYMYFKGKPLYPFGYGLSYTTFEYSNLRASSSQLMAQGEVRITVNVRNSGSWAGDEVVQMYVAHIGSKVARAQEELKGFQRISLAPGKKRTVQFILRAADLAFWNTDRAAWDLEANQIDVRIGSSSADIKLRTAVRVRVAGE